MAYAETTQVPVERTRAEIQRVLTKFGCTQFVIGEDQEQRTAMVQFRARNRIIRFVLSLPDPQDKRFTQDARASWRRRPDAAIERAYGQAHRQRWRALFLVLRAKLESVESQIATFEEEFLAQIVLPDDRTVGAVVQPLIEGAYSSGRMPRGLLGSGEVNQAVPHV